MTLSEFVLNCDVIDDIHDKSENIYNLCKTTNLFRKYPMHQNSFIFLENVCEIGTLQCKEGGHFE